jgi:protein-tyrosine-phosphatase/predicted ATP-grasp superfamily ATP-dependent carboligase
MGGSLILDGHSRAALEATQSLGRAGIEVIVAAEEPNSIAFHSRYARKKVIQPPVIPADGMIRWLEELDAQNQFDLIIPSTENSLQAFLQIDEDHRLHRIAVLPSNQSLLITLDKNLTRERAVRLAVPVPASRIILTPGEVSSGNGFPTVLKPLRSKLVEGDELKTFQPAIVQDEAARRSVLFDWITRMGVLEQEYVPGWGVGVEMLYREGKLMWYFAHERLHEWPLTGGASTYRRAIEPGPEMLEASRRFLNSLGWHGVAMVEFKRRRDGSFALMEVNPRLWGSLALSINSGVNFPLGLWQIAMGRPVPAQPKFRRGMRTRHLSGDLQWLRANLVADRGNPLLLTRPRLTSLLELVLPLCGLERWDHFRLRDPAPTFREISTLFGNAFQSVRNRWKIKTILWRRRGLIKSGVNRLARATPSKKPTILFICQANICRSPFAAAVAGRRLHKYQIESAGFDRRAGRRTPPSVAEEAERMGIDMSECTSTPLTADHIRRADLILVMELTQLEQLTKQFPNSTERVVPLGLFAFNSTVDIEDPNRKDAATTKRIMLQIVSAIDGLASAVTSPVGPVAEKSLSS